MILVTGNRGYIGPVMTKLLKEHSYRVLGLDADWFKDQSFFSFSEEFEPHKQIIKDIRSINEGDLEGIKAVIHLAALSNDPLGEMDSQLTDEINYKATLRLATLCKKKKVERFLLAASCSSYGMAGGGRAVCEEDSLDPRTAYAKSKVRSEIALKELANENFHPILMRCATVYGISPKQRLDLVVNQLVAQAYLTQQVSILSDGTPWRPLIHIEDFCLAFLVALEAPLEKIHAQVFNVGGNDENYCIKDIGEGIQNFDRSVRVQISQKASLDERSYKVDFSKIKNVLDFSPRCTLQKGIQALFEGYEKHGLSIPDLQSGKFSRIQTMKSYLEAHGL